MHGSVSQHYIKPGMLAMPIITEAGESGIQGHPQLPTKFKASLGSIRHGQKETKGEWKEGNDYSK